MFINKPSAKILFLAEGYLYKLKSSGLSTTSYKQLLKSNVAKMIRYMLPFLLLTIFSPILTILNSCNQANKMPTHEYCYIKPTYNEIKVSATKDTLHFPLNENTYNALKSFNLFIQAENEYISFYDERSESINIFRFNTQKFVKRINLRETFQGKTTYKIISYSKNLDTHYVTNFSKLYIINSKGQILNKIDFLKSPKNAYAKFDNASPPLLKDNYLFAAVRPYVKSTSRKALRDWKIIYKFDLNKDIATLKYNLPSFYQENLYGFYFLNYNFCYNDREHFVISFPADTNIYVTNLVGYHKAYYAKSKYQQEDIRPIPEEELEKDEGHREYRLRDSYGPIFFDPHAKRYLRLARQKLSQSDYDLKSRSQSQSIIIFDKNFHIIGESPFYNEFVYTSLFFAADGQMYARIKAEDEYALHFIRLEYSNPLNPTILP